MKNGKRYAVVSGVIFLLWGVIGLFVDSFLGVTTSGLQVWLFIIAGVAGMWLGLSGRGTTGYAKTFGIIFTAGGVLGFAAPAVMEIATLASGTVANIIHLLFGVWGLLAGFSGRGKKSSMEETEASMES